jgi:hypothetical protein
MAIRGANVCHGDGLQLKADIVELFQQFSFVAQVHEFLHDISVIGAKKRRYRVGLQNVQAIRVEELSKRGVPAWSSIGFADGKGDLPKRATQADFKTESFGR